MDTRWILRPVKNDMQRNILTSTVPLTISIILIIIVAKVGLGKVSSLRSEISQAQRDEATLTEKLNTLNALGGDLQTKSILSTYVIPDKNPGLAALSQIKLLATQNLIGISKLKVGGGTTLAKGLSTTSLTFDVIGPSEGVLAFINGLSTVAPIMHVDKVKLAQQTDQTSGTVTISSYYAPYPKELPSLTTAINGLTTDEVNTLSVIANLTPPQFISLTPSAAGKSDPFVQ